MGKDSDQFKVYLEWRSTFDFRFFRHVEGLDASTLSLRTTVMYRRVSHKFNASKMIQIGLRMVEKQSKYHIFFFPQTNLKLITGRIYCRRVGSQWYAGTIDWIGYGCYQVRVGFCAEPWSESNSNRNRDP